MPRILLVAPKFDSEFSLARVKAGLPKPRFVTGSMMAPLHLTTVAALTPDDWEVDIWDEGAHEEVTEDTNFAKEYDLVGTTAYIAHIPRAIEISRIFRKRGVPTAIGGPGVSHAPDKCRQEFDVVFIGEAEYTWPRFLKEFKLGHHRSEYRQVERPELSDTPVPRWELIRDDVAKYQLVGVQTTRGCPFDCEFCDVIHLFGRKPRHKPIDTVLKEVSLLKKLGGRRVFLCDDDFIGDFKYAKELLRELVALNNSFEAPMTFTTQCTIDLAKHDDIMKLMADCNFTLMFIGVETPRKDSLREANKLQNLQRDMAEDLHKIQSYGLMIKAGLMVGFDHDDKTIFQEQLDFAERAYLTATNITSMNGYPGTPQWVRYQREGRIIDVSEIYRMSPKVVTNVLPKQMTLPELLEGYGWLLSQIRDWQSFKRRMMGAIANVTYVPAHSKAPEFGMPEEVREEGRKWAASLPAEARQAMAEILMFTLQKAPHMLQQVGAVIMHQLVDWAMLPYQLGVIQQEIEMFNAGAFKPDVDDSAGMIPKDFEKAVKPVMTLIYDRLAPEVDYKPAVAEAFVDVMKDFLIRWGRGFAGFEDYHHAYLNELCDRHVERRNRRFAEGEGAFVDNVLSLTREQAAHFKFIREMLVAVDQELRGEVRLHKDVPLVQLGPPPASGVAAIA